jgi:hypothetical protein
MHRSDAEAGYKFLTKTPAISSYWQYVASMDITLRQKIPNIPSAYLDQRHKLVLFHSD